MAVHTSTNARAIAVAHVVILVFALLLTSPVFGDGFAEQFPKSKDAAAPQNKDEAAPRSKDAAAKISLDCIGKQTMTSYGGGEKFRTYSEQKRLSVIVDLADSSVLIDGIKITKSKITEESFSGRFEQKEGNIWNMESVDIDRNTGAFRFSYFYKSEDGTRIMSLVEGDCTAAPKKKF